MYCIAALLLGVITGGSVVYFDTTRALKEYDEITKQEAIEKLERILKSGNYNTDIIVSNDNNFHKVHVSRLSRETERSTSK